MADVRMPSPQELAEAIQREVLESVRAGTIPPDVASFTELHDYCDANCLGGTEALLDLASSQTGTRSLLWQFRL